MHDRITMITDRAISREGMAALGFGLTVLMIAIAGGLLMQTSDSLSDGGPILSVSADPVHTTGPNSQWVRLKHTSGDTVAVSDLELVVKLPDHTKRARLHGIPTERLTQDEYSGNHIFTRGRKGIDGVIASPNGSDATLEAGDWLSFRIEERRVDLQPGQRIEVVVHHTKSDTILAREDLNVVN